MSETTEKKEVTDYKARAKRAWETRRANAAKRQRGAASAAPALVAASFPRGRGRPRKDETRVLRFGQFEVTSSLYTYDQVKELGAAAVTTDGSSYRLLRQNGLIVPAATFERA